jgi:hypothetical protein
MLYFDFDWDVDRGGITLDKEINLEKLEWSKGDYFKLVECSDGSARLAKVSELEAFLLNGVTKDIDNNKKRE